MKYLKHYVMIIVLVLILISFGDIEMNKESSLSNYLPVQESLILVFHEGHFTNKDYPFNRIDPNVKEYLRFYLEEDNSATEAINNSIYLLGYVGDKDDVSYVNQYLRKYLSVPHSEAHHTQTANLAIKSGWFAGIMIKRDIEGSRNFFEKYASVSAWKFPGSDDSSALNRQVKDAYSFFVSGAYAFSKAEFILPYLRQKSPDGKPYAHESDLAALEKLETDIYTQYMSPCEMSADELKRNLNKYLAPNKTHIELLMEKKTYQEWRQEQEEKQKTGAANQNAGAVAAQKTETAALNDPEQAAYLESLVSQAVRAFKTIGRQIQSNEFGSIADILLDNGERIEPERIKSSDTKLTGAMKLEKDILDEISQVNLNTYTNYEIKVDVEATLENIDLIEDTNALTVSTENTVVPNVTGRETITVSFVIKDSDELCRKYLPKGDALGLTIYEGRLKVYMKRIDGRWYWNPFGW